MESYFWYAHNLSRFLLLSIKSIRWPCEDVLFKVESEVLLNLDIVMKEKLVLHEPQNKSTYAERAGGREGGVSPVFFVNRKKVP